MVDAADVYYWRRFLAPISFTYTTALSIYCQYKVSTQLHQFDLNQPYKSHNTIILSSCTFLMAILARLCPIYSCTICVFTDFHLGNG